MKEPATDKRFCHIGIALALFLYYLIHISIAKLENNL